MAEEKRGIGEMYTKTRTHIVEHGPGKNPQTDPPDRVVADITTWCDPAGVEVTDAALIARLEASAERQKG